MAHSVGVSLAFVEKLLRRHRTTSDIAPKPHGDGQRRCWDAAARAPVRQLVHDESDATLAELCTRAAETAGVCVSVLTMWRVGRRLGLLRKKSCSMRRSVTQRASSTRGDDHALIQPLGLCRNFCAEVQATLSGDDYAARE
jgi:transposase